MWNWLSKTFGIREIDAVHVTLAGWMFLIGALWTFFGVVCLFILWFPGYWLWVLSLDIYSQLFIMFIMPGVMTMFIPGFAWMAENVNFCEVSYISGSETEKGDEQE